jgi:hypothetical protein
MKRLIIEGADVDAVLYAVRAAQIEHPTLCAEDLFERLQAQLETPPDQVANREAWKDAIARYSETNPRK